MFPIEILALLRLDSSTWCQFFDCLEKNSFWWCKILIYSKNDLFIQWKYPFMVWQKKKDWCSRIWVKGWMGKYFEIQFMQWWRVWADALSWRKCTLFCTNLGRFLRCSDRPIMWRYKHQSALTKFCPSLSATIAVANPVLWLLICLQLSCSFTYSHTN